MVAISSADRVVDCDSLDPGVWNDDAMICARQEMYKPKLEYDILSEKFRKILQKHIYLHIQIYDLFYYSLDPLQKQAFRR